MQTTKAKVSTEFKKKLRQEYERLKKHQERTQKEVVDQTWIENRWVASERKCRQNNNKKRSINNGKSS